MKILTVCQHYHPEHFQITDICEALAARGHEVTVLTGLPNYPEGKIYAGYENKEKWHEEINGVRVIRCHEIGRKPGVMGLMVNYLSYCVPASLKALVMREKFDMVFAYQLSPILMAIPGIIYAKRNKKPLLLYCCDLWPESAKVLIPDGKGALFSAIRRVSRWVYRKADRIAVQSESFMPYLEEVNGISREKTVYQPQFGDSEYLNRTFRKENGVVDFMFLGNIGAAQNVDMIIEAAEKIKDTPGFRVHFVGDGSYAEEAKRLVREKGLEKTVLFHGRQPYEKMPAYYELADVCIATLRGGNVISQTIPSKVQGYMAAGKPVLAALDGAGMEKIREAECGICVSPGDLEGFAEAMLHMIGHPEELNAWGENGRAYFRAHFTKETFMDNLEKNITEMVVGQNVVL